MGFLIFMAATLNFATAQIAVNTGQHVMASAMFLVSTISTLVCGMRIQSAITEKHDKC